MGEPVAVDISFDFHRDTPSGGDPDKLSPTLHRYHRLLWGRPLPDGQDFHLDDVRPRHYLRHHSLAGRDFWLSSDAVMPTFTRSTRPRVAALVSQMDEVDNEEFYALAYTIGGMMLFPGNVVDGKMTLNQARGLHPLVADRFDLTIECIRRHYLGQVSPLSEVLSRYRDFFGLFGGFLEYVEHFLLQDMLTAHGSVKFLLPFDDFTSSPVPQDFAAYSAFREASVAFLRARNARIRQLAAELGDVI